MSRWLWALLGAWSSSRSQRSSGQPATRRISHPQFRSVPRLSPPRWLLSVLLRKPRPRLRPHLAPPAAQEAAAPPPPAPTPPPPPPAPTAPPDAGQQAASRRRPRRSPRRPQLRPSSPRSLTCSRSAGRTSPAASRARTGGVAGSRGHIRAQEPCAAGRDLGLFRGGLRAALPATRRRLGLSAAGGQVRPGRDCRVAEENPSPFRHLPD